MPTTGIRGNQIKDDSLTGDDIDESTLILNQIRDADGDTKVQVEESADEDKIRFDTAGAERAILDSTELLLNVPIHVMGANGTAEGIRIAKGDDDYRQIVFENDGTDAANIHLSNAENLVIMNETAGKDIQMWVDSQAGGDIQALTIKEDGKVGVGTPSPSTAFHAYADASNAYVATIDNDAGSAGHGLKVTSDGTGSGTYLLDIESASTTLFRIRGDGRIGIGKVTSLPAAVLTVSSSNADSDLAIAHKIHHIGDSDTSISFDVNQVSLEAGGSTQLKLDQLLTLNGADDNSEPYIAFTEGNASRAKIGINSSNNLEIQQQYTNKHIVFKVNDGGVTREAFRMDGAVPEVVVNQTSDSLVDFRVESDSNTHMLFVDGGNNRVGINTSVPVCELDVNGTIRTKAFGVQVRDVNSTSSVQAEDYCLRCIQTGAITITLPAKAQNVGRMLIIKDALGNASGNNITVDGDGSDTIDGSSTYVINRNGESVTILCDGINGWMLVSRIVP